MKRQMVRGMPGTRLPRTLGRAQDKPSAGRLRAVLTVATLLVLPAVLAGAQSSGSLPVAGWAATRGEPGARPGNHGQWVSRTRELGVMGTGLTIEVLGPEVTALDEALDAAVREIKRVEDLTTDWRPSELTRLNEAAGSGPYPVPEELSTLIARALELGSLTRGAFDITYAGVGRLWDFKALPPVVPDAATILRALGNVGYKRVRVDRVRSTVDLPAQMRLGLGGIAKGYGVDRAMTVLMEHGVRSAVVDAGGDLKALGQKGGRPWQIAVRHPREPERVIAMLPVSNTCVVTSGDYQRFFEYEGKRYHHIIDPRTGYPSEGCMSATVLGPDAATADALATALCVLGPDAGLSIIGQCPRFEALLVDMAGRVHASAGLQTVAH